MPSFADEKLVLDGPYESVWDAIEDDPVERARLKTLSELMHRLQQHIQQEGWTQKEAAKRLGVTQPRISDLMRGKISVFSIDAVMGMLTAAGLRVEVRVRAAA